VFAIQRKCCVKVPRADGKYFRWGSIVLRYEEHPESDSNDVPSQTAMDDDRQCLLHVAAKENICDIIPGSESRMPAVIRLHALHERAPLLVFSSLV
jgi:hypothetical protein